MADIFAWSIILITDFISIVLGCYSAYRFIRAYLDKQDLMKYRGYMINAFLLLIVFPVIITYGSLTLVEYYGGKYALVGIQVQMNDLRGINNRISFEAKEFQFRPNRENKMYLSITNEFQIQKEFTIDIVCIDSEKRCDEAIDLLVADESIHNIDPMVTFRLPLSVNIQDDIPSGKYHFNLTVGDGSHSLYDSIPLMISVG